MFHVISLQRTASKSLVSSLNKIVQQRPDRLELDNEPLGEFLHYCSANGYTFAPHLTKPFGHDDDVVFFNTHPKFKSPENVQFTYAYEHGNFHYSKCLPQTDLNCRDSQANAALGLLERYSNKRAFVLKTQLASLLTDCFSTPDAQDAYLDRLQNLHNTQGTCTIHLSRTNPLAWVSSMVLTHASGVFIPSTAQTNAISRFKDRPVTCSVDFVESLHKLWVLHESLKPLCSIHLLDTDLSNPLVLKTGNSIIELSPVPNTREFSVVDPAELIKNFDDVQELVQALWGKVPS